MGLGRLEPEAAVAAGDEGGSAAGRPEVHYRPHAYQVHRLGATFRQEAVLFTGVTHDLPYSSGKHAGICRNLPARGT